MNSLSDLENAIGLLGSFFAPQLGRKVPRQDLTDLLSPPSAPILKNTLNASPVATVMLATEAGIAYSVGWRIRGYDRDNSRCYLQEGVGLFSNVSGLLTELANGVVSEGQHPGGAMAAPVTVASPNLSVALTGEAAGTLGVDWDVRYWVTEIAHLNGES